MIILYKSEKTLLRLISVGVIVSIVYFVCKIVYAGIMALPYPKELLEPANVALTNLFLEGRNPYTVASLHWEVPGVNYDYPFLNSLVAASIAKITGCNSVTAHFALSLFSILASGYLGVLMVKDLATTTIAPLLAAILFMFCHWRYGYISAAPDDFGLFLFMLTMYAAVSKRIKNKPLICSIGTTLCFYTKQYFVFVCVPIFIYMLLYSRREAIKLFLWTLGINIVVAGTMWYTMPLYGIKAFLFTYLGTVGGGGSELSTFIEQFKYLIVLFAALFAVIIFALFVTIRRIIRNNEKIKSIINVKGNDAFTLCVISSVVMLAPLIMIGRNDGAFISYFLQLWIPSISVVALISLDRLIYDSHKSILIVVYALIAAFTIYIGFGKLPLHVLTSEEISNWEKAYGYTRQYSEIGDVFYSRSLAYDGFMRQNGQWMCGHEGEINVNTVDYVSESAIPNEALNYLKELVDQNIRYRDQILGKGKNREYSLITVEYVDEHSVFYRQTSQEFGYKLIDRLTLQLGNMPYDVLFYAR